LVFDDSGIFFYLCGFGMLLFGYEGLDFCGGDGVEMV
jgi:hypothetical protein